MTMNGDTIEYDVIIAGGGTAGCVIAGRLAAASPQLKILVLEQGPSTENQGGHVQPGVFLKNLIPAGATVKFCVGNKSDELCGRAPVVPMGVCLGGGSSVNFMVYTRASASDYDDWEYVHGNRGWGVKHVKPLLNKTETYQVQPDDPNHGYAGPLKVSYGGKTTNLSRQLLDVAKAYRRGRKVVDDAQNLTTSDAFSRWPKWISAETGKRQDVPHHFIYNHQAINPNLHILTGCKVKRIIFEGHRAVGVEYVYNTEVRPSSDPSTIHVARACQRIVVSAGALGSPGILERSGIGSKKVLERANVPILVHLPGVGENYQDHQSLPLPYRASEEEETLDDLLRGDEDVSSALLAEWHATGQGLMASNGIDAASKLRPTADELETMGPAFNEVWTQHFADAPLKPLIWMGMGSMYMGDHSKVPPGRYFSIGVYTEYPLSRGYIHITSGDDPYAPPDFETGFLSHPADLAPLIWGYKLSREFARRLPAYRGEYAPEHPSFPAGSDAVSVETERGVDVDARDIVYSEEDDKVVERFIRENVQTTWHSAGTCAMKAREKRGVVDERLRVYNVEGLMVADMSICPANVSANTYSTALLIGEKAAVLIGEDLGIEGV